MKFSVVNLGCKVNRVESDTVAAAYLNQGAELVSAPDADLIIVNTCTVTEEAEKKTRKTIRRVLRDNDQASIIVTGCATTIDPDFYRNLDSRITVVDKHDLLESLHSDDDSTDASMVLEHDNTLIRVGSSFPTRVGIKVQDGCNHSCTYCIVHVARGKAWSRPKHEIIHEALLLAQHGVKEIVLSGIDLGSYCYRDEQGRVTLSTLIKDLLEAFDVKGFNETRLRISSIEPRSISDDLIEVLAHANGRVCRHLHLPLQSGSTRILAEMNRPYTAQDYLALVNRLYEKVEGLSLTTDIIVGFPGETEEDFQQTFELANTIGFTKIHVFRYSKRSGTPAAERNDQIDPKIKEQRAHMLLRLSEKLRNDYLVTHASRKETIVVEQQGWGMSESYYKVKLRNEIPTGSVITASLATFDESGTVIA